MSDYDEYFYDEFCREKRRRVKNWSNAPEKILQKVADCIDCRPNLCKFRAVCKKWRSFSCKSTHILSPNLPRQVFYHYVFKSILGCENRLTFLVSSVTFLVKPLNFEPNDVNSPNLWIVSLEELNPGLLKLRYPLSKKPIGNLPKNFPKLLDSSKLRVWGIGKGYKFCHSNGDEDVFSKWACQGTQPITWGDYSTKVVLFDEDDLKGFFDQSFVVLLLNYGGVLGCMVRGDWFCYNYEKCYDDIVSFKGKVCALDRKGVAYLIEGRRSKAMKAISNGVSSERRKLLVESNGELYMVVRECYKFRVYKLNERQWKWVELSSLGERMLFVTFDGCYFVDAHDVGVYRGNCIFFPKNCFPDYSGDYSPDEELFRGESKYLEVGVFYMGEDRCHPVSAYPGLSNMFWPPPSWLWPHSCSVSWAFEYDDEVQKDSCSQEGVNNGDLVSFRQWSELPKELLTTIADHLDSELDLCRFRAVCRRWHSSCPFLGSLLCSQLPCMTYGHCSLISDHTESHRSTFVVARFIYLLRPLSQAIANSSTPWMISIEDLNPGKQRICHPLSKTTFRRFPWNFPKPLNLSDFQVSKLDVGFKLCFSNGDENIFGEYPYSCPWSDYPAPSKVILLGEEATSIRDCTLVILFLHRGGYLACQSLRTSQWNHINSDKERFSFDDIVSFKERVCAVDREGRAYLIDGYEMNVVSVISEGLSYNCFRKQSRKLLVESFGKLYMIDREDSEFKVYKLNEGQRQWNKVNSLGDRILFVSFDCCFFVEAKDIPGCRGNCIVFPKNCFPLYSGGYSPDYKFFDGESNHLAVGVFFLDENCSKKLSSYPGLSDLFWPPPSWLCPDSRPPPCDEDEQMSSSSESDSSWEEEEEEEITAEDAAFQDMDHLPSAADVPLEIFEGGAPTENFKGVSVRSDYVPILRKVWKRHGNVIEGHAVRSEGLLTWGLESLVKMILIIRNNRGKLSLDESQAKYLDSTLSDLQSMHFKLDWMVPIVVRVLTRHKKKDPADVLLELQTQRDKLLEKLHEVEEKLVEQNSIVNDFK